MQTLFTAMGLYVIYQDVVLFREDKNKKEYGKILVFGGIL